MMMKFQEDSYSTGKMLPEAVPSTFELEHDGVRTCGEMDQV